MRECDDLQIHWIISTAERVRTNTIVYIISQDHREGSVMLPHKMHYFHRKNENHFVNYKISI